MPLRLSARSAPRPFGKSRAFRAAKVEVTVQFLEKRLQEEESKSSRAESRVPRAEEV